MVVSSNTARASGLIAYCFLDEEQDKITLALSLDEHSRLNLVCVLGEDETK